MKPILLKGFGALVATGTVATGGFVAWKHSTKPTDVRSRLVWEGLTVADVNKKGVWGAIYLAKKDVAGFSDFVTSKDKVTSSSQLKQKCSSLLSVSSGNENYEKSYEEAKKWCLNPELKTIEMQFEFDEREFSSDDNDFKNLFVLHKGVANFVSAVQASVSGFTSETGLETAKDNVKTWCDAMKSKSPEGDDLKNAVSWCTKPDSNFKSFMEKKGFRLLKDGEWASRFSDLKTKQDSNLTSEVGESDNDGNLLKNWCTGKNLDLTQIHALTDELKKLETRCFIGK